MAIANEQQYSSAMVEIEEYLRKGFSNLTEKEEARLERLSREVEAWEIENFSMPVQS